MIGSNPQQWWRWPLMPIAAVGGGLLGTMLFALLQWFGMKLQGGFTEDGWMFRYILPTISSAVFGWLYVYISCTVAPKGKVIAGVVMTTILVIICMISIVIAWLRTDYTAGNSIQQTVGAIATVIAAVACMVQMHSEHGRKVA